MKKLVKKFVLWLEGWLPICWGLLWVAIITLASIGGFVWMLNWLLGLLGVL